MVDQPRFSTTSQSSPRNERNGRSKSRFTRPPKAIYLTDGQVSSSDHTNLSSSQKNIFRLQYQTKLRKLQKENTDLRELVITLKATQYYELDEQKIKGIIRENERLKMKITQLENDIKQMDEEMSGILVENEYLRRNNQAMKQDLEKVVRQNLREKHHSFLNTNNNNNKKAAFSSVSYGDDDKETPDQMNELFLQSRQSRQSTERMSRLLEKKKMLEGEIQKEKETKEHQFMSEFNQLTRRQGEKQRQRQKPINSNSNNRQPIENQQSIESIIVEKSNNIYSNNNILTTKSKVPPMMIMKPSQKSRNNKSRYRSSSKSGEKMLLNSVMSSKGLTTKRPLPSKKQPLQAATLPSTAQSQKSGDYHQKSYKTIHLRTQAKSRQPVTMPASRSPNPYESSGSGSEYIKRRNQLVGGGMTERGTTERGTTERITAGMATTTTADYNGEYYLSKRDNGLSKKKKSVYYN